MKSVFLVFAILAFAMRVPGQTNEPVKLALISESEEAASASDILTAELSKNSNLQLLERDEIEKVYREQGLSAGNKDYLKLGQVLGADGLLLLDVVRTPQSTNLMARFIAVKPGVILTDGSFDWPLKDTAQWAESVSSYLNLLLPKLSVQATDAIPISVVNLRSAVASAEGAETERQLKLLTIQRLSQEKELFVLERQKMQLLSEEKDLKLDDSAFWNGSYLLEGVVDQNGYSKETVTVNARLTPPKGGAPLQFEVSASRTNLSEVINQLAEKVNEALKISSTVPAWNTADEAAQYFGEAQWALRWGILSEAQAAADSAWALGKRDMDCATARVKAYEVPPNTGGYQNGEFTNPSGTNEVIQTAIESAGTNHIWGLTLAEQHFGGIKVFQYVSVGKFPDPKCIDSAMRALELYYEFSQTLSPNEPKADSDWYRLGIEVLTVASEVLQHFHFVRESQPTAAEKLADLRALSRSVAEWISKSPSVHDSYFVGDRVSTHDELAHTISESPNIFRCKVKWGCFWQEAPEDCIALYRELISSPVFRYIHEDFWLRDLQTPRVTAWTENDRQRVPMVWNNFVVELNASTNVLLQLESKAVALADADSEKKVAAAFTNLFDCIFENRDVLVANPVEVLYAGWGVDGLVSTKTGSGILTPTSDSLHSLYYSKYWPKLEAMDQEYRNNADQLIRANQFQAAFEQQKEYLKQNKPYDFIEFANVFQNKDYSEAQALEIQPLIIAYRSNLVAQSKSASGIQRAQSMGAIAQVGFLEVDVNHVLNPPAPRPQIPTQASASPQAPAPKPASVVKVTAIPPALDNTPEVVTNVVSVNQSFTIPMERLLAPDGLQRINDTSQVTITAHHWCEGKLLLDVEYMLQYAEGSTDFAGQKSGQAIAIFDPATKNWEVIASPDAAIQTQNRFYNRTVLVNGGLFNCDGEEIRKYDFGSRQWQTLNISDGNNYQLFTVNRKLYAANGNTIFEIIDGGKGTRILASTRRRPPVSILDTQDLGTPVLFEGPNHSLRASSGSNIFIFTENDWREDLAMPPASFPPEAYPDGMLFRLGASGARHPVSLSFLPTESSAAELYLWQKTPAVSAITLPPSQAITPSAKPLWEMPPHIFLGNLPVTVKQSNLYLLVEHSQAQNVLGQKAWEGIIGRKFLPKDGYEAVLLCYSKDFPLPQKVYLNFDAPNSCQALAGSNPSAIQWAPSMPPVWLFCSDNFLLFGLEIPRGSIPFPGMPQRTDVGGTASVWLIPLSQIEDACATQKQIQLAQKAQEAAQARAVAEQAQKKQEQMQELLLAKYDRNHNGVIDSEEKEEALDDPAFIESELDEIDANHNGWLDASELAYFDANTNKILEPKEQAGIEIAQHLLAERLLKKFDANGNGWLDRAEFNELMQVSMVTNTRTSPVYANPVWASFPDDNHDGHIDLIELETFLKQQTRSGLRSRGMPSAAFLNHFNGDPNQSIDPRQLFKAAVEAYWQNPGGIAHRRPFNSQIPPGPGIVTNRLQGNLNQ